MLSCLSCVSERTSHKHFPFNMFKAGLGLIIFSSNMLLNLFLTVC